MKNDINEEVVDKKINRKKKRKAVRRFFIGLLLIFIAFTAVLSVRQQYKEKQDRILIQNAYGTYFTTRTGEKMNYTLWDNESDELVVILPGYGCSSVYYEFNSFAKDLNEDYKVLMVEPLGVGLSDETERPRTVDNYCEELHELISYLGYDSYILAGHSIAGLYALKYANIYEDEVSAFIGIDASVPHQVDSLSGIALPDNQAKLNRVLKELYVNSGYHRFLTEITFDSTLSAIPTIPESDKDIARAMFCTNQLNDTQLVEMDMLQENIDECYDIKFPETIPVLYVLAQDNVDAMPEWEQIHKDAVTSKMSKVVTIEGSHYLHLTNREKLINIIKDFLS